jgi:ABC-type dipeptide/oligopeptide/nickel transport system permease subunit
MQVDRGAASDSGPYSQRLRGGISGQVKGIPASLQSVLRPLRLHRQSRSVRRTPGDLPALRTRRALTPSLVLGGGIVVALVVIAVLAPWLAPYGANDVGAGAPLSPPSRSHYFGTDSLGRDLFSRILQGTRIALAMATGGVLLASLIGVPLGLVAGFYGRRTDQVLSRLMEVWLAFPGLLLALIIVARLGPSLANTILALGIVGVPSYFRLMRNGTLAAKHLSYVEAARCLGLGDLQILGRHILPNLASSVIVLATLRMGMLLLAGGGLSFIGLGAQPPLPEWGAMLAAGRDYMESAPWLALFPGLFLTASVIAFNLLGDGLRDWLDPVRRSGR